MKKTVLFTIISAFLLISTNSNAQILTPVKWKFYTKQISSDIVELKAEAVIDANWHLYGQYSEPAGGIPAEFIFNKNSTYKKSGTNLLKKSYTYQSM